MELLPEMKREDADVELVFVKKNNVAFTHPAEDLIFSAHFEGHDGLNNTFYLSDSSVSGVACAQQVRRPEERIGFHALTPSQVSVLRH